MSGGAVVDGLVVAVEVGETDDGEEQDYGQ